MAKSDSRFGYQADLGRDVHDLSAPFVLTCAPGQLLPIFEDLATPGDAYYVNHDLTFLRTQPLLAPAMVDVKVHLESFFVPAFLIYEPFGATIFDIQDIYSSMYSNGAAPLQQIFPKMIFEDIHDLCLNDWKHTKRRHDIVRLMDLFEMNPYSYIGDEDDNPSYFHWNPSVFPWQWLAYHCIYQYYYRLDDKEQFDPTMFNFDQFRTMSEINMGLIDLSFWQIHQRPWDFDYFTSLYRSPIVSDVNVNQIMPAGGYSDLLNYDIYQRPIKTTGDNSDNNNQSATFAAFSPSQPGTGVAVKQAVNTAMIRQLFANEKLAMVTGRARKTYDSQVLAHFGTKVQHDVKHDITMIGHDEYDLKIGEVTSLSSSDTASLGTLAGKGWSQGQGKQHKFVAPCHGVIMTIFSIEPKKRYYGGYNRINSIINAFDIPIPEFDRLGNMPMFRYETGEVSGSGAVTAVDIVGWKERYYPFKRRHARCTLAFMNPTVHNAGYNEWASYAIASAPFGAYTSTNNHTARPDLLSRFYIDTHAMDALMVSPYLDNWQNGLSGEESSENWNASPWLSYQRDPFIVDMDLKVKKVSWMSKDGEPIYNF